jgi:RNA polymerase sigma-70 factor, ECF subfamily
MLATEISEQSSECRQAAFHASRGWSRQAPPLKAPPLKEDLDLVERLRRGDNTAYEEVVRKFGGRLLSTAQRFLRSEDDARDALQDALLSAVKSIDRFKGNSQLSTWLHRIVINSALGILREKRRRCAGQQVPIEDMLPRFDADGAWLVESPQTIAVHVAFEASETRAMVRKCIARLPDHYRLVLMLRDVEEFATDEVAEMLGLTLTNVKVRLHRARQALKALIEHEHLLD